MPVDDLKKLYDYLISNKQHVKRLPKPVVTYEHYRDLKRDLDDMEEMRNLKKLYNELTPELKKQANELDGVGSNNLKNLANKFLKLKPDEQKFFISKVRGYSNILEFISSLEGYIDQIESGETQVQIRKKVIDTPNAYITYDNEENNILIAHVDSYDASKSLGCTSQWCISRDPSYWRQYKRGGNKYFFIWDFNKPVNDNEYLVGTAYNESNPDSSQTHVKDDTQIKLNKVITNKNLNYDIFNNYIEKYNAEFMKQHEGSTGLMGAISEYNKTKDADQLINVISDSETIEMYSSPESVEEKYDTIYLGFDGDDMAELLGINIDDYDNVKSIATNYYSDNYADEDELNYMHNTLDSDNENLIKDIAKAIGYNNEQITEIFSSDEGQMKDFFEDNGMVIVNEEYISEYGNAMNTAQETKANEMLETVPFDIEEGSIGISDMIDYIKDNNLSDIDTFDLFVRHVIDNADINIDGIYEYYDVMDFDNLNSAIKQELEKILDDIETDEDNEYSQRYSINEEIRETLSKLGFKEYNDYDALYRKEQKDKTITINHIVINTDSKETKLKITFKYKDGHERKGKISLRKIKDYVDQLEIPELRE